MASWLNLVKSVARWNVDHEGSASTSEGIHRDLPEVQTRFQLACTYHTDNIYISMMKCNERFILCTHRTSRMCFIITSGTLTMKAFKMFLYFLHLSI